MSLVNYKRFSFGFEGFIIKNQVIDDKACSITLHIELPRKVHTCPVCTAKTAKIKDYRLQKIKDADILGYSAILYLKKRRYICQECGKCFYEENKLLGKYQRITIRLNKLIYKEFAIMQSFSAIAARFGFSIPSIIRRYDRIKHPLPKLPPTLSIDEFRGNAGGEKFQCILTDPYRKEVLDILPSRKSEDLVAYFLQFTEHERRKVKLVSMDMSNIFRPVARLVFPSAEIVADKFHVIRNVLWALENVRKREQKLFHKAKRKWFKRSKKFLLCPACRLSLEERLEVNHMLNQSEALSAAYSLKESFYGIFKAKSSLEAKHKLSNWLQLVERLGLKEFSSCKGWCLSWGNEISKIIDHKGISNGYTEGCNNKIKVLKRISYGVRNFERFRNRILYLCA